MNDHVGHKELDHNPTSIKAKIEERNPSKNPLPLKTHTPLTSTNQDNKCHHYMATTQHLLGCGTLYQSGNIYASDPLLSSSRPSLIFLHLHHTHMTTKFLWVPLQFLDLMDCLPRFTLFDVHVRKQEDLHFQGICFQDFFFLKWNASVNGV